jgi:hypothetical protein
MRLREAAVGAIAAFALNWAWENGQAPLYAGYVGFVRDVGMCTKAALGDVVIVALIFGLVALAWRDADWHRRSLAPYGVSVLVGIAVAVAIERWALASGRWAYDGMPLVPFTGIGLAPVLQMILLPPLVFFLMRRAAARAAER